MFEVGALKRFDGRFEVEKVARTMKERTVVRKGVLWKRLVG